MTRLVVATWNLWGRNAPGTYTRDRGISRGAIPGSPAARELDARRTWERRRPLIVGALRESKADVVAVQESMREEGRASCASEIADDLGFTCVQDEHPRGVAVLSRWPVTAATVLAVVSPIHGYPRPFVVALDLETTSLRCVVVHVPLERLGDRTALFTELADRLGQLPRPVVVCGDLNADPGQPLLARLLAAGLDDASATVGPTVPNPGPVVRLDYVLVGSGVTVGSARRLGERADADGFLASDHLGIAVELEL